MLTAEELEKKKKRDAERMWKKILAYYMMETYVTRSQAQAEAELRGAYLAASRYVREHGLLNRLFEKKGGQPAPAELLARIGSFEPPDSPLGELYAEMRKAPPSEEKLNKALTRVIAEEPPRMIEAADRERERRAEWERANSAAAKEADGFEIVDEERIRYEQLLALKMEFLRAVMPPELYQELEQKLETGAYTVSEEQLKDQAKEQPGTVSYADYVKDKRVEPEEKAGRLANTGDVYSAAAYMLAAYEQKDAPGYDAEKADRRAMELSGSRAFKAYMKGHPGSLLAAARGSAVEETHSAVAALDADLSRRDAILANTRDSLRKLATGRTPCFHRMLNALDRFVNADTEPTQREKASLVNALGEYITTDCSPGSREYSRDCFTQAMRSVKALLPARDFERVVEQVNADRSQKVRAADFDAPEPAGERTREGPARETNCAQGSRPERAGTMRDAPQIARGM